MNILVIEDEQKVAAFLKNGLLSHGYNVDLAYDSYTGERLALQNEYEMIILDVIIPGVNGISLCKKLKELKQHLPILLLTALGTSDDKLAGFEAGADDYLVKPFEFKELVARIKVLTRKALNTAYSEDIRVGDLVLNLKKKSATRGEKRIPLSSKEFALLSFLMRNKGNVISRHDIVTEVWGMKFDTGTNVVDVYINFLRKKIDANYPEKLIQTRVGFGYVIDDQR